MWEFFENIVFLCLRNRPDTNPAVESMITRLKKNNLENYKNMVRVILYLREKRNLSLNLEAGKANIYQVVGVHLIFRSHLNEYL